jgi:hypothetical protein
MIAALYVRADSVYKSMGLDAWDIERDAAKYSGPHPIIAHPPCRSWGRFRKLAKPRPGEKELGVLAVAQVRTWGGVLEHPQASSLWKACNLPLPRRGAVDEFGGFTLDVEQYWWGHKAKKRTWLYVCGCKPSDVPSMPIRISEPEYYVTPGNLRKGDAGYKPSITKSEREATPPEFAKWLADLAGKCKPIVSPKQWQRIPIQ